MTEVVNNTEIGQVRFFDHRKGFGFIDVLDTSSDNYGRELFFHFSQIRCESSFKKVIPGELVEFEVETKPDDNTKELCVNLRGVRGATMLIDHPVYVYKFNKKRQFTRRDDEEEGPSAETNDN